MRRFLRDNAHLSSLLHKGQTQVQEFHQAFFDVVRHAQLFDSMKVASTDADTSYSTPSKFNLITLGQDELQVLLSVSCIRNTKINYSWMDCRSVLRNIIILHSITASFHQRITYLLKPYSCSLVTVK
jgi:hypothetical protein